MTANKYLNNEGGAEPVLNSECTKIGNYMSTHIVVKHLGIINSM